MRRYQYFVGSFDVREERPAPITTRPGMKVRGFEKSDAMTTIDNKLKKSFARIKARKASRLDGQRRSL